MKNFNFFILLSFSALFAITSCSDDNGGNIKDNCVDDANAFVDFYNEEIAKLNSATMELLDNPNASDACQKFKQAAEDFIDAVEDLEDCARASNNLEAWRTSVQETRQTLADLTC